MAPPMSLKGSARKGKKPETLTDASASKQNSKRACNKRAPRTRVPVAPREMDVSITISVGSSDIPKELLGKMEEFFDKYCVSGLCSIERGSSMSPLHLQMVCRLLSSSVTMVNKRIKQHLEWDDPKKAPPGHHILTKALCNVGLNTYIGMLGYCIKDMGEEHFECVQKNVTDAQLKEGVEEFIKHGAPFAKNCVVLTHTNLIERAAMYCKYKLRKQIGSTLPGTLLPMLQSGQYIPSTSWMLPVRQGGMEFCRVASLWKCMMNPQALEMSDVTQIFFQHTNPGSCLAKLGRHQLAAQLDEAQEGIVHEFNIPDDTRVPPVPELNNVIVLDGSQGDPLPK